MEDRERQLQAVMNAVTILKESLGPTFDNADKRVCRYMKAVISIRKVREELEELAARHMITIEEKEPEKGGWILS